MKAKTKFLTIENKAKQDRGGVGAPKRWFGRIFFQYLFQRGLGVSPSLLSNCKELFDLQRVPTILMLSFYHCVSILNTHAIKSLTWGGLGGFSPQYTLLYGV